MTFTTERRYFSGSEKSFRIPYGKIVSISGYSNGISIVRDLVSTQPQYFLNGDNESWLEANRFNALAQQ